MEKDGMRDCGAHGERPPSASACDGDSGGKGKSSSGHMPRGVE